MILQPQTLAVVCSADANSRDRDRLARLAALPEDERMFVRRWAAALESIQPPIEAALRGIAARFGVSYATARRYYDKLRMTRDPLALVNRSRVRDQVERLAPEFVAEWHRRFCANQRKGRPAYQKLVADFFAGLPIPGVPSPDEAPRRQLPRGWSYSRLMQLQPDAHTTVTMRIGPSAAAVHRPLVYTTRADLWVGSHYLFDDIWHDLMVNVLDTQQTGRPLEFHALDLYSACKVGWGFRVRTEDPTTGIMQGLREEMMRAIVAQVLGDRGYSATRGTSLVVEHGTAAIREDLERLLHEITGGRVTVNRSGMEGDPAFVGQYAGRSKGNFRFKAALESFGNLVHNRLADLPGQTGMDVDRRPEALHGLLRDNDGLLRVLAVMQEVRPDLVERLRMPLLSREQFGEALLWITQEINQRTEHRLEGWARNVVPAADGRTMRRMSPAEVWARDCGQLTRFTPAQIALVLWRDDSAAERTVRSRMIEVWQKDLAADPLRYDARALTEGERYACIVSAFAPQTLFAFDARGAFVAACPLIERASRADTDALKRQFGRVAKIEAELRRPIEAVGAQLIRDRIDRARHNAEVIREAGLTGAQGTPETRRLERRAAQAGAAIARSIEQLAPAPQEPVPSEIFDARDDQRPADAEVIDQV